MVSHLMIWLRNGIKHNLNMLMQIWKQIHYNDQHLWKLQSANGRKNKFSKHNAVQDDVSMLKYIILSRHIHRVSGTETLSCIVLYSCRKQCFLSFGEGNRCWLKLYDSLVISVYSEYQYHKTKVDFENWFHTKLYSIN